ncbi:dihydrofolate reductase family protein [Pseudomonas sp. MBLB4123]|uniref:dihydrofolate reductase family protein n=1 Tax=Pseudomonas sp. MBLB4123 TaxID=3451557 RepID=UPI003F752A32
MKTSVYIATSLDGYIARSDGELDWLPANGSAEDGEDYGYQAFMDTVDILVMGRCTYEQVLTFDDWPYGETPVVVLSRQALQIPEHLTGRVEVMACPPAELVERLAERGAKHLYIDGGQTIQGFLRAGLIQQLIITRVPILIGAGVALFGPLEQDIRWRHLGTRTFANGLVQSRYRRLG